MTDVDVERGDARKPPVESVSPRAEEPPPTVRPWPAGPVQGRGLTPWSRRINNNAAAGGQRALPVNDTVTYSLRPAGSQNTAQARGPTDHGERTAAVPTGPPIWVYELARDRRSRAGLNRVSTAGFF